MATDRWQVVSNCVCALNEILSDEGGMAINKQIVHHLLNRMREFNEWSQCIILDLVARYKPGEQQETFDIMNLCVVGSAGSRRQPVPTRAAWTHLGSVARL